ncbi:MAG: ABC transporter ATP-binding protein [Chloroflexi bacterium]|nr:ABC transporter ATP-binding protein [Chloroflexota bacterium]MQC48100.1 ABC transporter ATP-binding protein [Chloroflexota bacterium]
MNTTSVGTSTVAIEARGLSRAYGGVRVLRDVSLTLPAGSKTALLGSNGAGKTTLVNLLSTLVSPTSGSFRIAGMDVTSARVRHAIGVLGHRPMLYEDFSPLENLEFFARVYDVADAEPRIEELLRAVGLWMRRHEQTAILSRGYHQRLALARALLHRPSVLIADEPETGLDPEGMALLDDLALRDPALTVLAATHRIDHIDAWATGIVRLERGRVVEDTSSITGDAA